jgi:hypothetical protein
MKKVFRAIELLVAIIAGFVVYFYIMDNAPWQIKIASGLIFIVSISKLVRD